MSEYESLTSEIEVPKDWPVETGRNVIIHLVESAINRHRSGQKVIVIIGKVSALITDNETRPGYVLKKIEDMNNEGAYIIHIIFPVKTLILTLESGGSTYRETEMVELLPTNLRSNHPISKLFVSRSSRHKVVTVVPNLKKILQIEGVSGPDMCNHTLQTTYRVQKINWLQDIIPQNGLSQSTLGDPTISIEQVADDELEIVCYQYIPRPQRFECNWQTALICIRVFVSLLMWICFTYIWILISQKL